MPRQARIAFPSALHYVIGRGIERKISLRKTRIKKSFSIDLKNC
jgi:hypothetical protein